MIEGMLDTSLGAIQEDLDKYIKEEEDNKEKRGKRSDRSTSRERSYSR